MEENSTLQKLSSEAIGTGLLVFIGVGSVPATLMVNGDSPFTMADLGIISFAFMAIVVAMVYGLGHISGCHINPAVTLGFAATGNFPWKDVPSYLAAQVVGAFVGGLAIFAVLGSAALDFSLGIAQWGVAETHTHAFFAELIGTGILVFTVMAVLDKRAAAGWYGLAIGLIVFAVIIVVAPATSASINPARTFGPMVALQVLGGEVPWYQLPSYLGGEFLGGVLAALAYVGLSRTRAPQGAAPLPTEERAA